MNEDLTGLLRKWGEGDPAALEALTPIVYAELRRMAHRQLARERNEHTLQSTALVNEAFLRLISGPDVAWQDRAHFFAVSSQLIRRILVDHARTREAAKRGSGATMVEFEEALIAGQPKAIELIALDDALEALAKLDPIQSKIVELRFFGGLSTEEIAHALKRSPRSIGRSWASARLWLLREMKREK